MGEGELVGPLDSGQPASLLCEAVGGRPPPPVLWLRNGLVVDSTWDILPQEATAEDRLQQQQEVEETRVRNVLQLPRVGRTEAVDRFTCRSGNSSISNANNSNGDVIEVTVGLSVNFPPHTVTISGLPEEIHTGKALHVRCRAVGARPSALITWWLDGQVLQLPQDDNGGVVVDEDDSAKDGSGASVSSYLYRKFVAEDNGRTLTCRAVNPVLLTGSHHPPVEASHRLNVLFPPRPRLVYGTNIRAEEVREGQDVYLQCQAAANPPVGRLTWARNGFSVAAGRQHSSGGGGGNVLVSGSSLVLQGVGREMSGNYTCTVSNSVGDAVRSASIPCIIRTLQRKFHLCVPRKGTVRPSVPISTFMCLRAIYVYIPRIGPHIFL